MEDKSSAKPLPKKIPNAIKEITPALIMLILAFIAVGLLLLAASCITFAH